MKNNATSERTMEFIKQNAIVLVLILEFIFFTINTDNFLSASNLFNVLRQVSTTGIVCVGMTFVMITGGIDLSVGAEVGLSVVVCASLMVNGWGILPACIAAILAAMLVGFINGLLVANVGIPSLIATLGTQTAVRGAVYIWTNCLPIFGFPEEFRVLGQGYILGVIPVPVVIMLCVLILAWVYINMTKYGRYTYAIGGNEEVTRLSGIKVKVMKNATYVISGFCAGLAGVILLSRLFSGQPRAGINYEMDAITAVVLGGVSVTGGAGRLSGVIVGFLIIGLLSNGFTMMGVNEYWQTFLKGIILLTAVGLDVRSVSRRKKQVVIDADSGGSAQ